MSFEDNLADGDPSDDDLSGDNPSDTGEQEMEQQVVLHLQAPETVPMGTAGSFGLSAQNTAATAAAVSIQLTQEEMEKFRPLNTYNRTGESPDEFFETGTFE